MTWRLLPVLALALPVAAHAATAPDPHTIAARVRADGAEKTVAALDAAGQLDDVLTKIGKGADAWVALAPQIAPGTDGSAAEGLGIVLATALPRNPAAVLRVLTTDKGGVISVERVCGTPFIETSRASDAAYGRRAVRAVSRVSAPDLPAKRDACLARLKPYGTRRPWGEGSAICLPQPPPGLSAEELVSRKLPPGMPATVALSAVPVCANSPPGLGVRISGEIAPIGS